MNTKDIFHFDLTIETTNKKQLENAIAFLIDKNFSFTFNQIKDQDSYDPAIFSLYIENLSWVDNLDKLLKILKEDEIDLTYDYEKERD